MSKSKIPKAITSLLDIHQQPFVLVDKDYTIVASNKAYSEQYNQLPEQIVGKKCYQVSHHSERPCIENGEDCPHQRMFKSGQMEKAIHVHTRHDGAKDCVEICAHPIYGDDGEIQFMGEQLRPIEHKKALEKNGLIGESPEFLSVIQEANQLASIDMPVLIYGESGVGKEGLAHYLHNRSERADKPFIILDCCGLSEQLFESELFGHEAGAFTDAHKRKIGLYEAANGGTLFLDEIGEISPVIQSKLLRVIETGQFRRVGGTATLESNVRIVSATNKNLHDMVDTGEFRADLYFRIAGHTLTPPPLRERTSDIIKLGCYFMNKTGKTILPTRKTLQMLEEYPYPGNVRELKHIIELAALKAKDSTTLKPEHLPDFIYNKTAHTPDQKEQSTSSSPIQNDFERYALGVDREEVLRALKLYSGSRRKAADTLGITERKLYRLIKRYRDSGIEIPGKYSVLNT
ncbi:MAG: sigma 54-interacting transcriptional regulator [Methylococcaceae bacterium]